MLDDMNENKWYRVRFNADGEVTRVGSDNVDDNNDKLANEGRPDQDLDFDDFWDLYDNKGNIYADPANVPYAYVYQHDANKINDAINVPGVDTVLYHEIFDATKDKPTNSGKTLYVTQDLDAYIRFTDNTVVVFEQENNNEWTTEFWAGQSGVERAIRELRATDEYSISAVIEDGRATTIVIYDGSPDGDSGNWTESNVVEDGDGQFRLHGTNDQANGLKALAKSVSYNENTDRVDYSFTVIDVATEKAIGNQTFTYDLVVYIDGTKFAGDFENKVGTTSSNGLIADTFDLAAVKENEDVDIWVTNVRPVSDDIYTLTLTDSDLIGTIDPDGKLTGDASIYLGDGSNPAEEPEIVQSFGTLSPL